MSELRHDWTKEEIVALYNKPLLELVYEAATVHRKYHNPNEVQVSTLLSIKTGGCPEDCAYCPQAARYHTDIDTNDLMTVSQVKAQALRAKESGSSRVCMGAAWRNVEDGPEFDQVLDMVRTINELDMEVCCTLGMLSENQAQRLAEAGLYAYNHNLETAEDFYPEIVTTHTWQERYETCQNVNKVGLRLVTGGIFGLGETQEQRISMLKSLASLNPRNVPINFFHPNEALPIVENSITREEAFELIKLTREMIPNAEKIMVAGGRELMFGDEQYKIFEKGANAFVIGDYLTTAGRTPAEDIAELEKQGIKVIRERD